MTYDRIYRHAECLRTEMEQFAHELDRIVLSSGHSNDPALFIERHMSTELEYDLVYQDAAGNIIGIQIAAEDGSSVMLSSRTSAVGITSHIYAGHILGGTGILPRGTVVVACSCLEGPFIEKGTRLLVEESLPRLGITVDAAILAEPSPALASTIPVIGGGQGRDKQAATLEVAVKSPDLAEATSSTAALAYRYLLTR